MNVWEREAFYKKRLRIYYTISMIWMILVGGVYLHSTDFITIKFFNNDVVVTSNLTYSQDGKVFVNKILQNYTTQNPINITKKCDGENIQTTANCFVNNIKPYFKYHIQSDVMRTDYEILTNGGDCFDYTNLYKMWANELGFKYRTVLTEIDKNTNHIFIILYNEDGYCKLDQLLSPDCESYGVLSINNETEKNKINKKD